MNKICSLFGIKYPIIQGGMVWVSGYKLVAAVSNAGGLGVLGAGSMYPDILREHIRKCKKATDKPFAVNVPLMYPDIEQLMEVIMDEKVPVVFTSAGNPKLWTQKLKDQGIQVVHVVSSLKFAQKAEAAGVDALVCEGFEAGGHNGREETASMVLIPLIAQQTNLPLLAAGGISCGRSMKAALTLGADGVQIGSRFAIAAESSAHERFKKAVMMAKQGDTVLTLKELAPVRMMKNDFYMKLVELYKKHATADELRSFLGRGRTKKGMFDGDLIEGELEIGQVASRLDEILSVKEIFQEIVEEFNQVQIDTLPSFSKDDF